MFSSMKHVHVLVFNNNGFGVRCANDCLHRISPVGLVFTVMPTDGNNCSVLDGIEPAIGQIVFACSALYTAWLHLSLDVQLLSATTVSEHVVQTCFQQHRYRNMWYKFVYNDDIRDCHTNIITTTVS